MKIFKLKKHIIVSIFTATLLWIFMYAFQSGFDLSFSHWFYSFSFSIIPIFLCYFILECCYQFLPKKWNPVLISLSFISIINAIILLFEIFDETVSYKTDDYISLIIFLITLISLNYISNKIPYFNR